MKPVMLYAIIAVAAIAIVASFGFQLGNPPPVVPASVADSVLFVCPMENLTWNSIAMGLYPFNRYIVGGFFFTAVLLLFGWGWELYQNLLSDKFKRESFKNIWGFTKIWFWALVIVTLLIYTPNHFRRVEITGASGDWVLCNASDLCDTGAPDCHARTVRADAVHAH